MQHARCLLLNCLNICRQSDHWFHLVLGPQRETAVFSNPVAIPAQLAEVKELYGGERSNLTLNGLRYQLFKKAAAKASFNLGRLSPTQDAAKLHLFRTYHQVQQLLGYKKNPPKWVWVATAGGLSSKMVSRGVAPSYLLNMISCNWKKECSKCSQFTDLETWDTNSGTVSLDFLDQILCQDSPCMKNRVFWTPIYFYAQFQPNSCNRFWNSHKSVSQKAWNRQTEIFMFKRLWSWGTCTPYTRRRLKILHK